MADLQLFFYEEVHQEQKELIFDEDFNKGGIDPHYTYSMDTFVATELDEGQLIFFQLSQKLL